MIEVYSARNKLSPQEITAENKNLLSEALWIDLLNPTEEEENIIEDYLGLDIPTRKEMQEIELSSRLYRKNDALYMIANVIAKSDTPHPRSDAVTLISCQE